MTSTRSHRNGQASAAALLATASLVALLAGMPTAAAEDCASHGAPPADIATPSMLYETLRSHTNAQLLAVGFLRKPVDRACAWIYEVKVLTAAGSVVELDFDADGLDLVGARGPDNDRDAAALVRNFGGDAALLTTKATKERSDGPDTASGAGSSSGKGSTGSGDRDDHGGDADGDGGHSGGGGNSGSGGGGEGGEGGNSGSGGGDGGGGGEGGDGGGEGGDGGGEGGDD